MRIVILIAASLTFQAAPALAHPDHDMDSEAPRPAAMIARDHVVRLISQAKLPASWSKATVESSKQRNVKGVSQTVVTFQNAAEKDAAKRSFHVVVGRDGDIVSADHVLK
ncbi:MAG: DUF6488 family protein [Pseudomonadota bacterium]|jgi:hypothetical protein